MQQHGDAKLTNLLSTLADCPKARSASIHNRCRTMYGQRLPQDLARQSRRTARESKRPACISANDTGL
jgi:hypothetical protein